MRIREGIMQDVQELLELLQTTPELQGTEDKDSLYSEEFVKATLLDKERNLVLIAESEENQGFAGILIAELWKEKHYSFLLNLVVQSEYRKQGVGRMLMNKYEEICRESDILTIVALVQTTNERMQRFCVKNGLKKGRTFYYYEKKI